MAKTSVKTDGFKDDREVKKWPCSLKENGVFCMQKILLAVWCFVVGDPDETDESCLI